MIKLKEVLELTRMADRLKIVSGNNLLYIGYKGLLDWENEEIKSAGIDPDMEVTNLTYSHEVRDKHWKENGRTAPIQKESVPDILYADLEERLYLYIRVKKAA